MKRLNQLGRSLGKEEQRSIKGAYREPGDGGGGGSELGCYQCCWTGTTNCSVCVLSYSTAKCTEGATLTSCLPCNS